MTSGLISVKICTELSDLRGAEPEHEESLGRVNESEKVECSGKARVPSFNEGGDNAKALRSCVSLDITEASFDSNCDVCNAAVANVFWHCKV